MSVFTPIPKKGNAKECSNYRTIALISHASQVILKILQSRLQQYINHELPDVQAAYRKGRGIRDKIANIRWIMEKAREFQKNSSGCWRLISSMFLTRTSWRKTTHANGYYGTWPGWAVSVSVSPNKESLLIMIED